MQVKDDGRDRGGWHDVFDEVSPLERSFIFTDERLEQKITDWVRKTAAKFPTERFELRGLEFELLDLPTVKTWQYDRRELDGD